MAIEQLDAELALKRLATVVRAAEDVCTNRAEMVSVFVAAIGTTAAASPCCGKTALDVAIAQLTKLRDNLPKSQAAMRAAVIAGKAGAS